MHLPNLVQHILPEKCFHSVNTVKTDFKTNFYF